MKRLILLTTVGLACGTFGAIADTAKLFEESFPNCTSSTIQGGYFAESLYFDATTMADNAGWYTENCYMSERAIKFSAKTKHGTAATPVIRAAEPGGEITVSFRAQSWSSDNVDLNVELKGVDGTMQTVDVDNNTSVTDRNTAPHILTFTNVPAEFQVYFTTSPKESGGVRRLFLSDVLVTQEVEQADTWIYASTGYQHFNDLMVGNDSEIRMVTAKVQGVKTADPEFSLPDNSEFTIVDIAQTDCEYPESTVSIAFNPRNAGIKEEVLTISYGDTSKTIILKGNARVYRPESLSISECSNNSATFSFPDFAGYDRIEAKVWRLEEGPLVSSDLMITKYVEGKSSNRALELFNGTDHMVNLMGYTLYMEQNGAGGLTSCKFGLPDTDLFPGETYTICDANFSALRDIADRTIGYNDGGYSNIMSFTGDDAIGLFNPSDRLIDIIGYESIDVNDRVSGEWGTDKTFYRKANVYEPQSKFYTEEWDVYEMDYAEGFGSHNMDARGMVRKFVSEVEFDAPVSEFTVDNLTEGVYYATFRGISNGLYTHYAPVVELVLETEKIESITNRSDLLKIVGGTIIMDDDTVAYSLEGNLIGRGKFSIHGHGIIIIRTASGIVQKVVY